jgi:hypothetical protein
MSITVDDAARSRLYAMVREAQLRGIQPLAIKAEKRAASTTPNAKKKAKKAKAAAAQQPIASHALDHQHEAEAID